MPLRHRAARALLLMWLLGVPVLGIAGRKPLPELSQEEEQLRALVQPLRDGGTQGATVQPLLEWLEARRAAGRGRAAERDLRRVLKRIHDDYEDDLLQAAQWVHRLQVQRSKLYTGLAEENAGLEHTLEKYNDSPPVPDLDELLPGSTGISDAFLGSSNVAREDAAESAPARPPPGIDLPEPADRGGTDGATTDMDKPRLLNRITLELTELGHLLHQCDNEYEAERDRHREALKALATVLKEHPEVKRRPDQQSVPPT